MYVHCFNLFAPHQHQRLVCGVAAPDKASDWQESMQVSLFWAQSMQLTYRIHDERNGVIRCMTATCKATAKHMMLYSIGDEMQQLRKAVSRSWGLEV
jgi:hypothetical protein